MNPQSLAALRLPGWRRLGRDDRGVSGPRRGDGCFFFQAEDGIRGLTVTGVQTCALPISASVIEAKALAVLSLLAALVVIPCLYRIFAALGASPEFDIPAIAAVAVTVSCPLLRSEERRVGKECGSRWSSSDSKRTLRKRRQ